MLTLANEIVTTIGIAFVSLVSLRYLVWLAAHFYTELYIACLEMTDRIHRHADKRLGIRVGDGE